MAIAEQWPQARPYGGRHANVFPHPTIAYTSDEDVLSDLEMDVSKSLPIRATLVEACLYVFDGALWQTRARLPFRD